jgi:hypothetical protein
MLTDLVTPVRVDAALDIVPMSMTDVEMLWLIDDANDADFNADWPGQAPSLEPTRVKRWEAKLDW